MSKGKKKKKHKKDPDKTKQSNIKTFVCVDCPKDPLMIVKQDTCRACEYYAEGYCKFIIPAQKITIVSHGTPMKYNRSYFQGASTDVANTTRNYYLLTKIMEGVRAIKGYPNFSKLKASFLEGNFKEEDDIKINESTGNITPLLSLLQAETDEPDMIVGGQSYQISDNGKCNGEWDILYYLYDEFSLDGFADIKILDKWYKVRLSPFKDLKEDLVVAQQQNKIIIGRRK